MPGAVEAEHTGVAAHYGQPLIEQRSLDQGTALVDLSHQGVITVSGPDRLTWLNSFTSQRIDRLRPGEAAETLLLDPNGRIQHVIRLVDDGETAWLLVDEGTSEDLVAFLTRMRFALRVEIADEAERYATVLAFAGDLLDHVRKHCDVVAEWVDPWGTVQPGGFEYFDAEQGSHPAAHGWSATRLVIPREQLTTVRDLLAGRMRATAGLMSLDALEIFAWRPTGTGEVDERALPHEFDWLRSAVHLNKGCYRGQETVAKVHNLGHPPRRLTMLQLDGVTGELPPRGALIREAGAGDDARPLGRITRAALHYEWGGIALALLKRTAPIDAELEVMLESGGTVQATQETIVPPDAGSTRNVPRLPRLG